MFNYTAERKKRMNSSDRSGHERFRKFNTMPPFVKKHITEKYGTIIDQGSGKHAPATKKLNKAGYHFVPFEIGDNFVERRHDPAAFYRRDIRGVVGANMMNVQENRKQVGEVLDTSNKTAHEFMAYNVPKSPNDSKLTAEQLARMMEDRGMEAEIDDSFDSPWVIGRKKGHCGKTADACWERFR